MLLKVTRMRIENLASDADDFTGNAWIMENGETVLIDTGTGDSWQEIEKLEHVDKVVITHSHYDHVDNLPKVMDRWEPDVYAYEPGNLPVEAEKLRDEEKVELAGVEFLVIHTPGHKDDSICLYSTSQKILFTGDLIFPGGSFGRTDLDEGDRDLLIESIEKIAELDINSFYPGHDNAVKENAEEQVQKSLEEARKRESKY